MVSHSLEAGGSQPECHQGRFLERACFLLGDGCLPATPSHVLSSVCEWEGRGRVLVLTFPVLPVQTLPILLILMTVLYLPHLLKGFILNSHIGGKGFSVWIRGT